MLTPRLKIAAGACALALLVPLSASATRCPNLYIVLDKSGSMADSGKWTHAKTAIQLFTGGTATVGSKQVPRQSLMRFGLMLYPSDDECGAGTHQVSSDFYTAAAINSALGRFSPEGATPTGEALEAAGRTADLSDTLRRKFVVLITDGAPTCKPDFPFDHVTAGTRNYAVQSVQALRSSDASRDVKSFIVGFGAGVDPATLDAMAEAGGTARVGTAHKYYEASDSASLTAVFDAIAVVAAGEIGTALCDDSCYANPCPAGQKCVADVVSYGAAQMNLGRCQPDSCWGMDCGADRFCRDGACIAACTVPCGFGEICRDGQCLADPCIGGTCTCASPCADHLVCVEGACVDEPCRGLRCPSSAPLCSRGSCYAVPSGQPDAGTPAADGSTRPPDDDEGDKTVGDGAQGCTCGAAAGTPYAIAGLLLLLGLRRRRG